MRDGHERGGARHSKLPVELGGGRSADGPSIPRDLPVSYKLGIHEALFPVLVLNIKTKECSHRYTVYKSVVCKE